MTDTVTGVTTVYGKPEGGASGFFQLNGTTSAVRPNLPADSIKCAFAHRYANYTTTNWIRNSQSRKGVYFNLVVSCRIETCRD